MTYYEHNNIKYPSIDDACKDGAVIAIRGYRFLGNDENTVKWYADTDSLEGWPITEEQAVYLSEKFNIPVETI